MPRPTPAEDRDAVAAMADRIAGHWAAASAEDLAAGLAWYGRARSAARALAAGTDLDTRQAAGVIAALSPRVQWQPNLDGAAAMIAAASAGEPEPVCAGTTANRSKAWRIANGEAAGDVLGGPKVRAFWANITGDVDAVTVDVWAARAAEGPDWTPAAPAGRRYARIADAYRMAADRLGEEPRTVQAAVWTFIRGDAGGTYRPSVARAGHRAGRAV